MGGCDEKIFPIMEWDKTKIRECIYLYTNMYIYDILVVYKYMNRYYSTLE